MARFKNGSAALGVIYNPKRPQDECNFNILNGSNVPFDLAGKKSNAGLPEFIQSYFDVPHFDVEMVCFTDTTKFKLTNPANVQSISWDFGDAGSGSNTSTLMEPTHTFSAEGDYDVTVTENGTYTYIEKVHINKLPESDLPDTAYMYSGANTSSILVDTPGKYWVTVQNQKCCYKTDTVTVILFDILVPNAFRPGGTNTMFRATPTSGEEVR